MGGNAIEFSQRLTRSEYERVKSELTTFLKDHYECVGVPQEYFSKDSFGDIDIVLSNSISELSQNSRKLIEQTFNPQKIHSNGSVISFDYENKYQIDFVFTKKKWFESSLFYFSYNDLNNLAGKLAYQLGVKFGHNGLFLKYRHENGGKIINIELTTDPRKIYDYIGLDYDQYLKGFETVEEIFEFIISSKYFSYEIFQLDNLNHRNRVRNRKRKNFTLFLDYLEDNNITQTYEYKNKEKQIERAAKAFPEANVYQKINDFRDRINLQRSASEKFNGRNVMELTGLKGKELGILMKTLKSNFQSSEKFYKFVLNTSDTDLNKFVFDQLEQLKSKNNGL